MPFDPDSGPFGNLDGRGLLCRPDPDHLAGALLQLAASPALRRRLGAAATAQARGRSWERSLEQLAAGYCRALGPAAAGAPAQPLVQVA